MRTALISFSLGAAIATLVALVLYRISPTSAPHSQDTQLVDFAVDEWTLARIDPAFAGITAHKELPDARVGFFPDTVRALARRIDSLYDVPKGVTLAQWALESRFGLSNLGASNYFGHTFAAVKKYMDVPKYVTRREQTVVAGRITTGQPVRFADYASIAACFETHGRYLSQSELYRSAFQTDDPEEFVRILSRRYATDPDYAIKLIVIMRRYHLNEG